MINIILLFYIIIYNQKRGEAGSPRHRKVEAFRRKTFIDPVSKEEISLSQKYVHRSRISLKDTAKPPPGAAVADSVSEAVTSSVEIVYACGLVL